MFIKEKGKRNSNKTRLCCTQFKIFNFFNSLYQKISLPVIEHKRRSVGAFPEYWFIIPWLWARGVGILNVIALWNLRRLGSTVTTGETATPRPNNLAVNSGSIGCA